MPYIVLKEPGFESFNGLFGTVMFENGRSIESISSMEAERFGAITRCVTEDGDNPSTVQKQLDARNDKAEVKKPLESVDHTPAQTEALKTVEYDFTRESLEKAADEGGIKGLRVIGDQHGVKGRSVAEIISELLALKEKPAESQEEPAEPEEGTEASESEVVFEGDSGLEGDE